MKCKVILHDIYMTIKTSQNNMIWCPGWFCKFLNYLQNPVPSAVAQICWNCFVWHGFSKTFPLHSQRQLVLFKYYSISNVTLETVLRNTLVPVASSTDNKSSFHVTSPLGHFCFVFIFYLIVFSFCCVCMWKIHSIFFCIFFQYTINSGFFLQCLWNINHLHVIYSTRQVYVKHIKQDL